MASSAAFFHDHVFRLDGKGDVYSPGRLPYSAFGRYLDVFEDVLVVARATSPDGSMVGLELSSGPRLRFFLSQQRHSRLASLLHFGALRSEIRRQVASVDAVIVRLPSYRGVMAAEAALAQDKPLAAEVVGLALEGYQAHGSRLGQAYGRWMETRCRKALAASDHALYVTDHFLQHRYPCFGVTAAASNVVLPDRNEAWISARLAKIARNDGSFVLGFVGSLSSPHKGLDLALATVANLRRRGVDVRLKVAGDGSQAKWRSEVARLGLSNHVDFLGTLPGVVAVTKIMRDIDLLVHPSRSEGLPRAVVEAMWVGCPVVASCAGGTGELLDPTCLHEVGDARNFERLVLRMLDEPSFSAWAIKRNWDYSEKFQLSRLDSIRAEFWQSFARYTRNKTGD